MSGVCFRSCTGMVPPAYLTRGVTLLVIWAFILVLTSVTQVSAIGCFVCTSLNGSEPDCEDTFNNTGRFYQEECFAGRKGRSGLFPGTECIKLKAQHPATGFVVVVRDCTVDDGGVNSESEMGRESHCWMVNMVKFDGTTMDGCVVACKTDGCNAGTSTRPVRSTLVFVTLLAVIITYAWKT